MVLHNKRLFIAVRRPFTYTVWIQFLNIFKHFVFFAQGTDHYKIIHYSLHTFLFTFSMFLCICHGYSARYDSLILCIDHCWDKRTVAGLHAAPRRQHSFSSKEKERPVTSCNYLVIGLQIFQLFLAEKLEKAQGSFYWHSSQSSCVKTCPALV